MSDQYTTLKNVLDRAYEQAATGKGNERHGNGLPYDDQPMQQISRLLGTTEGMAFQAIKKTQEAMRMERTAAVREILGAINYLAGIVIYLDGDDES